jgi:hypothetical protein
MRAAHGDKVFILAHRIKAIAKRTHPRDTAAYIRTGRLLVEQEERGLSYMVQTTWLTSLTGAVYIHDAAGKRYSAHHSDVMRI